MEEVLKVLCFFPSQIQKAVEVRKLIHFMVDDHLCQPKNKSSTLGTVAQSEVLPSNLPFKGIELSKHS